MTSDKQCQQAIQVADLIEWHKKACTAHYVAFMLVAHPGVDVHSILNAVDITETAHLNLGRKDGSSYRIPDVHKVLDLVQSQPDRIRRFNLEALTNVLTVVISEVGDALTRNGYFDKTPELDFFRHVRNGVSHGNAFHFEHGEPRRPARFSGFTIVASMEGQQVLPRRRKDKAFLWHGDVFDMLDHVEAHLRHYAGCGGPPGECQLTIHTGVLDTGEETLALEMRPRHGIWAPFFVGILSEQRYRVSPKLMHGLAGQVPLSTDDDTWGAGEFCPPGSDFWCLRAGNEATPQKSYFLICNELPLRIIFGVENREPQYDMVLERDEEGVPKAR